MRILKERFQFRELVANVLTFDYLGALGASLLFPLMLVPKLGLVRSAILFGLDQRRSGALVHVPFQSHLPRPACSAPPARRGPVAVRRIGGRELDHRHGRRRALLRRGDLRPDHTLSAHGRDPLEGGLSASISIPTSSSAPATSTAITRRWCIPDSPSLRRAARAGSRRRRRSGRAGNAEVSRASSPSRWSTSIRR